MKEEKIRSLAEYFGKQKEVKLAYLFGSAAKGTEGKLSDIDIGVYLDEKLSKSKRFDIRLKLISEISSVLKTDKIDVVVMNDSPTHLNYNIIKYGKILKSSQMRAKTEFNILKRYLDMSYYIKRHTELAIKRIAERGLS